MKKQMTRAISLALFAALVLGLFGGIPALTTTAASAEADAKVGVLLNPGFEEIDSETGLPKYWNVYGPNRITIKDGTTAPEDVFEGRYAINIASKPGEGGGIEWTGINSDLFPIEAGVTYEVAAAAKDFCTTHRGYQVGMMFFDKDKRQLVSVYRETPQAGEWNYTGINCTAPEDAVYARVWIYNGAGKGDAIFDSVTFKKSDAHSNKPTAFDGTWKLATSEYPRVFMSKDDLAKVQKLANSEVVSAYGYSGAAAKAELIKWAETYIAETSMSINHAGTMLDYELYPVLKDYTTRKEYETPPAGQADGYPYTTAVSQEVIKRVEILAHAYAITGEVKYGERAKQYALDISNFEWWVGYHTTVVVGGGSEKSSQITGYLFDSVSMVYDLCNDLLSAEDKAKMEKAMIEKGLEAEYHDCWPRMSRNRDMDHATGLIFGALAIMNENNIEQMKKYLDMGVAYINWRLDHFMYSGINEGESYDSGAVEDIIAAMAALENVTGYTDAIDHPYMAELEKRIIGNFEPVAGNMPAYSDSECESEYFPNSAAYFAKKGNKMAEYYLAIGDAIKGDVVGKLVNITETPLEGYTAPSDREGNVVYVGSHGFGTLRTGWGALDPMLVVRANDSDQSHNHFEQNSIQLAFGGNYILGDTGYQDLTYSDMYVWQSRYTNSTIYVDGKPQIIKGNGSLEQVFNTHVYGYLLGSAPGAYGMEDGEAVLNKFDRHMIMLNHDENPYYVIIDDLDSNKNRTFSSNLFTNGWDRLEVDGKGVESGAVATGNSIAIAKTGAILHSYFVGDPVISSEVGYASYGPTLTLSSEKTKNHQFMNVMSVEKSAGGQWTTVFQNLRPEGEIKTTDQFRDTGKINWSSTRPTESQSTTLNVTVASAPLIMFRAGNPGDWISFPFQVEEAGELRVAFTAAKTTGYYGLWDLYIDDQLVLEEFDPHKDSGANELINVELGKIQLTKGEHRFKAVLKSTTRTPEQATFFSLGSIMLDNGKGLGQGNVKVVESYNDGDLLGATINYGTALNDIVLFNRGTGSIAGGKLATNGQQASVLGASETAINEGYAVTNGTSLKYGDQVLVNANGAVSLAVDFTLAKDGKAEEGFNAAKPVIYISSKADAARTASVYIGIDAGYTATVDGEAVAVTYANGMLTLNVPEGEHEIVVTGDTTVAPGPAPAPEGGEDQPDATADTTAIVGMIAVMILAATTMVTMVVGSKKRAF